jgi:phage-related protein
VFIEFIGVTGAFKAATAEVETAIAGVKKSGGGALAQIGKASTVAAAAIGAAAVAVGAKAIEQAGDYQFQMNRLVHAANEVPANLQMVHDGVLKLMGSTGTTAKDATDAMYLVESAGYHGADGLKVLQAAMQGAKIEGANTADVARALSGLLNDYHLKATDAANVTSTLVSAVGHGMTTFQELATAMPNVASQASQYHLQLNELAAAMATMTMHGTDAATAGTYLRQMLGHLAGPTATARKAMESLGIDANKLGLTLTSGSGHGLYDAIKMVEQGITSHLQPSGLVAMDVFKKSKGTVSDYQKMLANLPPTMVTAMGALQTMTGGVKNFQGFLQLGGPNLATYAKNAREIGSAAADSKGNVEGWADTQKTFNNTLQRFKATIQVVLIQLGEKLIPLFQSVVSWLTKNKTTVEVVAAALVGFAAAVGTVKVAMMLARGAMLLYSVAAKAVAAAQWLINAAMDANPIMLIVTAIVALGAGIYEAYQHFEPFRHAVDNVGHAFVWLWHKVLEPVVNFFKQHWKAALEIAVAVVAPFLALPLIIVTHWHQILNFFEALPGRVVGFLKNAGKWLLGIGGDILHGLLDGIEGAGHLLWDWFVGLPVKILQLAAQAGMWLLGKGEDLIGGLWNGIVNAAEKVWDWLGSLPRLLLQFTADADRWLLNVGSDIIHGLWNGITGAFGWLKDKIKGLGGDIIGWAKDALSIFSPSKRMADEVGKFIPLGIAKGITDNAHYAKNAMNTLAGALSGTQVGVPAMAGGGVGALALAGAGGQVVNVNVTVQGSVQAEKDLAATIQTQFLQNGARRGGARTFQDYRR